MTTYHVNPDIGKAGPCRMDSSNPRSKGCPFASPDEHYPTLEAARAAYESKMESHLFPVLGGDETVDLSTRLTPIVRKELSPAAQKALRSYQGIHFDLINDELRKYGRATGLLDYDTKVIDHLFDKSKLTEKPVKLYRSIKSSGGTNYTPQVGEVFTDKAYMSCSQNPGFQEYLEDTWYEYGEEHGDNAPCESDLVIEFDLPKGSKALPLPMRTRIEKQEQEVLLPRNSQIRITERIEEKDNEGNTRIRLKGEFVSSDA